MVANYTFRLLPDRDQKFFHTLIFNLLYEHIEEIKLLSKA
jgi:hypothetical protein